MEVQSLDFVNLSDIDPDELLRDSLEDKFTFGEAEYTMVYKSEIVNLIHQLDDKDDNDQSQITELKDRVNSLPDNVFINLEN